MVIVGHKMLNGLLSRTERINKLTRKFGLGIVGNTSQSQRKDKGTGYSGMHVPLNDFQYTIYQYLIFKDYTF